MRRRFARYGGALARGFYHGGRAEHEYKMPHVESARDSSEIQQQM